MDAEEFHQQLQCSQDAQNQTSSISEIEKGKLSTSYASSDREGLDICRVCQCVEPDGRGDAALVFLDITPPSEVHHQIDGIHASNKDTVNGSQVCGDDAKDLEKGSDLVEFIGPEGEVFICQTDVEAEKYHHQDALIELGCSCKNELALAHYACALRWFINHGSTVCEICGNVAKNVRTDDFYKVMASLKHCETLRQRTAAGELPPLHVPNQPNHREVDPDAVAAIRRQRLMEISLWFNPHNNLTGVSLGASEQASTTPVEETTSNENLAMKWAIEGVGILVATGLLTVALAWLIAPRVGKKTARSGLHILLGGFCALTVVVFLRFAILPRTKYGPARYWAILFVFWLLVFAIWASRSRTG